MGLGGTACSFLVSNGRLCSCTFCGFSHRAVALHSVARPLLARQRLRRPLECAVPPEFCIWGADVPSYSVFLALKKAGAWNWLLLPQRDPLFSALLTLGDPALLAGRWWTCVCAHPFPLLCQRLCPPGPAFPAPTWDQSATWDRSWSTRVTLVHSASLGQVTLAPGGWDWVVLTEEGDQYSN